jgi:hypothetical protein
MVCFRRCRIPASRCPHRAVPLDQFRRFAGGVVAAGRHLDRRDACRGRYGILIGPPLFDRLYERRSLSAALFRLPLLLHLFDARLGNCGRSRPAVLWLGRRGARELSPDRLLVSKTLGKRGRYQGFHRQPYRRFRFCARYFRDVHADRFGQFRDHLRGRAGIGRQDHQLFRLACGRDDADLPAPVHGSNGQVGTIFAAHLVAGCDGRTNPGLRADPRSDHGHGWCLHGGATVAAVRARPNRAGCGDVLRRDDGLSSAL